MANQRNCNKKLILCYLNQNNHYTKTIVQSTPHYNQTCPIFQMQQPQTQPPAPTQRPDQQPLQQVSRQQLLTLARQKTKQAKTLSAKISKLETKYLDNYKQVKLLRKDFSTFVQTLKIVFGNVEEKQPGAWEIAEIRERWEMRERDAGKKIEEMETRMGQERKEVEDRIKAEVAEKLRIQQGKTAQRMNTLENETKQLKLYNEKLIKQIGVIQQSFVKNKEELKTETEKKVQLEMELNRIKVNEAKKQLQKTLNNFGDRKEDVQARTETLAMRQEIDRLHGKIDELNDMISKLQIKLRAKNKQIEILKEKHQAHLKQHQYPPLIPSTNPPPSHDPHSLVTIPLQKNPSQKLRQQKQKQKETEPLQKQYFKNIFIRFMKCLNESNYMQAQTLENVLMTLLEFNSREREQAAVRQKTWWNIFQ